MTRNIILNGKFLSAAPTGVHRVAAELGNALAALAKEGHPVMNGVNLQVWAPANAVDRIKDVDLPHRILGPFVGIPWEQITLPLRKGDATILSLCNIGPVLARNAVTMIHDAQTHISPASYSTGFRLWYAHVQPAFARRHRHILTVSEFSRQEIARVGLAPLDRISVVHNGVDHMLRETPDTIILSSLALARHGYVLGLATVQAHKNIVRLMEAFASPHLADLKLVLFGSANRKDFEDLSISVPPNVIFAGRISDAELCALAAHALCMAFPSQTEGFGLPPLEAMVLGCPAIVAPCGALPEVCGSAALYADADDTMAWVTAISGLAQDMDRRNQWSEAGKAHAAHFTWRRAAEKLAMVMAEA